MAGAAQNLNEAVQHARSEREEAVRRRRGWYIAEGILFITGGLAAFIIPGVTVWGVEILLAALLLVSGAYQLYHGFADRSGWMIFSGAVSLALGLFLVVMPVAGVIAVATTIALFLFVEGIVEIALALQTRFSSRWGWLLASGILSILLSILLLIGWPEQTVMLAGILLGVNFIFYGVAILAVVGSVGRHQ